MNRLRYGTLKPNFRGMTLIEVLLVLSISTVIILAAIRYYPTIRNNANMVTTVQLVGVIGDAVRTYAQSPAYTPGTITLSTLQAAGLLTTTQTVNPWGGPLAVATSGNYLSISFYNVPVLYNTDSKNNTVVTGICVALATQLSNSLPLPSPGTVKIKGTAYTITNPSGGGVAVSKNPPNAKTFSGAAICQVKSMTDVTGVLTVVMDLS